jgi:NAD-dependent deacetylase
MDDITAAASTLKAMIDNSDNVVVFTGAGISTDSGLPDFRGPNGIWTKDPGAEKVFNISHFKKDPDIRDKYWSSRIGKISALPNDGHKAIASLYNAGKVSRVITQNIDGLHQASGIPDIHVSELHGSMANVYCMKCHIVMPIQEFLDDCYDANLPPSIFPCGKCGGFFKPGVIMFGEILDKRTWIIAEKAVLSADLVLAIGSSLSVYPAAGLVGLAQDRSTPTAIINATVTPYDDDANIVIRGGIGDILSLVVDSGS